MVTVYEIPLKATPQRLSIRLGGTDYVLQTRWNLFGPCWVMDIYDVDYNLIYGGIALVTGVDLLEQLQYLDLHMSLYVVNTTGDAVPGYNDFGATSFLYYVPR